MCQTQSLVHPRSLYLNAFSASHGLPHRHILLPMFEMEPVIFPETAPPTVVHIAVNDMLHQCLWLPCENQHRKMGAATRSCHVFLCTHKQSASPIYLIAKCVRKSSLSSIPLLPLAYSKLPSFSTCPISWQLGLFAKDRIYEKFSPFISHWGRGGVYLQTVCEEWKHLVYTLILSMGDLCSQYSPR